MSDEMNGRRKDTELFVMRSRMPASAEDLFQWHDRPGAFERLAPPWDRVEVLERSGGIGNGDRVTVRMWLGPVSVRWSLRHADYVRGRQFRDIQISGPFASWVHTHSMVPESVDSSWLEDRIDYALPFGVLGRMFGRRIASDKLLGLFTYRHALTGADLAEHSRYRDRPRMRVLVSGAGGLVGSALVPFLTTGGHTVVRLVRGDGPSRDGVICWRPDRGEIDRSELEGFDAVIHLAGESIVGRWNERKKQAILDSREQDTHLLAESFSGLTSPPRVLIGASAVGYYGTRGDTMLDESAPSGDLFLSDVCRRWEGAMSSAIFSDIRVAAVRFGVVLSPNGGALGQMLPPFRLGLGGRLGHGRQYFPWISREDAVGAIHHVMMNDIQGPVNLVAPDQVTNMEFTRTLGSVLRRPAVAPVPGFVLRALFGSMADELLLASTRAVPSRLIESGYRFRHPDLRGALEAMLGTARNRTIHEEG